jgi:hypothetical protein
VKGDSGLYTPPVGGLWEIECRWKKTSRQMDLETEPRDGDVSGASVTPQLWPELPVDHDPVVMPYESTLEFSCVPSTSVRDTTGRKRPIVTMDRAMRYLDMPTTWLDLDLPEGEELQTNFIKLWDKRGVQRPFTTDPQEFAEMAPIQKDLREKEGFRTDRLVDLKWHTGLRNVVLHFRVPRNRITRARCLQALNARKQIKLATEEKMRTWKRERLSTSGHLKDLTQEEREEAKQWRGFHLQGATTCTRRWGHRKRQSADKDIPMKYSTDPYGFPRRCRTSSRRAYFSSRPAATYDELGEGRNFFVFAADSENRKERFVYTIFPASGSVVVTGLRQMPTVTQFVDKVSKLRDDQIPAAITTFSRITDIPPQEVTEMRVTNSTWSGTLLHPSNKEVKLGSVMEVLSSYSDWLNRENEKKAHEVSISFRSQFFPGARLQHLRMRGTINLFNNGSFVIIGVTKAWHVRRLLVWLSAIMNEHWKNPLGGKSCAWIAV